MTDLVRQVSDVFPVGTTVSAYPGNAWAHGAGYDRPPATGAAAVDSAAVASNGTVTLTLLTDNTSYVLAATVSSRPRAIKVTHNQGFTAATKWKDKVAARRAAIGTS